MSVRFHCIVYPFKQKLTIANSKLIIVVIWVLAVSIMFPSGVMLQVTQEQMVRIIVGDKDDTRPFYWCRENWPSQAMRKVYTTILFANIYLAPLSLIVVMYARIGITLSKTATPFTKGSGNASREGEGNKSTGEGRHTISRKKSRVIVMLVVVALLFVLSWLPLWTLMMLNDYASLTEYQHRVINIYVYPFAHWLAFFNSSINPIIYGFFNDNFRRGFQAAFKFQLCTADSKRKLAFSLGVRGHAMRHVLPVTFRSSGPRVRSRLERTRKDSNQGGGDINGQSLTLGQLEKVSSI